MLIALLLSAAFSTTPGDTLRIRPPASGIGTADSLVLQKAEHRLTLYAKGRPLRTYLVALGRTPTGAKTRLGDGRTPEGLYRVDSHNPNSQFHLALHISYPSAADRARARRGGYDPGGDIMIHGLPDQYARVGALHRQHDWTEGCVAVTDAEIEEIYRAVPDGTAILIVPE